MHVSRCRISSERSVITGTWTNKIVAVVPNLYGTHATVLHNEGRS